MEDEYHAVIGCTKSRALRHAMRKEWNLPPEEKIWFTGGDWLQVLLSTESQDMRAKLLLLFWRCWFLRDNIVHGNGKESILGSVCYLTRFETDWKQAALDKHTMQRDSKSAQYAPKATPAKQSHGKWIPPPVGVAKLNTDASFFPNSGDCWGEAVARDDQGRIIISVCKELPPSVSVLEAEGRAALVGLLALASVYKGPVLLESDCKSLIDEIREDSQNRSPCYGLVNDLKATLAIFAEHQIVHVPRLCNSLAHELAVEARSTGDQVLLAEVPSRIRKILISECNPH